MLTEYALQRQCFVCEEPAVWRWVYDPGFTPTGLPAGDPVCVRLCKEHMPKEPQPPARDRLGQAAFWYETDNDCVGCTPERCGYPACREGERRAPADRSAAQALVVHHTALPLESIDRGNPV
jgi:hypothetical protein